jgi:hypothetical protein
MSPLANYGARLCVLVCVWGGAGGGSVSARRQAASGEVAMRSTQ